MPSAVTIALPPRYRDARHVASGGMAAVYAAQDSVLGRAVAIKVLSAHVAEDPDAVRRFQREARAAARVSQHPHVVTIYDVDEHDGQTLIVMELMEGGSLSAVLREGRPPREDALRWVAEAASALDAAHERDIVHRDIKPGNLLLDDRRRLGVADFGIARLAYESSVTMTGQVLGTAAYVSPEQARGEGATAASDRYALAVVAYELLTGARPFPGGTFAAQARQHVEDEPTPAHSLATDLRPAIDGVLQRGLAKDPAARWPSAAEFAEALALAAGEDATEVTRPIAAATAPAGGATPPPKRPVAAGAAPAMPAGRAAGPSSRRPPTRRAARWLPAALVGLLVLLVAVIALASGGSDKSAQRASGPARTQPARTTSTPTASTPSATSAPATAASGISSLNDQGFALVNQGRYDEAIPLLQQAVTQCGDSRDTVCAYALYNLGHSLRKAGRPAEAIPVLERRLGYDNQTGAVQAELDAARREAAGGATPAPSGGDGKGKGKGNGKSKGRGNGDHQGNGGGEG
ncbi:MAG: eukaryotic-like serine/threonine-protein kinase [Solirubrobacteraceae bacterium]|jgi:serine/threonine-protein kinase|nr:eukaryotic-like serine/threonine-protein kinase [Solirubrobacteraceae bacterium]